MDPAHDLLVRRCGCPLAQAQGESSPQKERKSECLVCSEHLPPSLDRFGFEADKGSAARGFSVRILTGSDRNELKCKQAGSFSALVRELAGSEGWGRQAWRLGSQKQCPKSHCGARIGGRVARARAMAGTTAVSGTGICSPDLPPHSGFCLARLLCIASF